VTTARDNGYSFPWKFVEPAAGHRTFLIVDLLFSSEEASFLANRPEATWNGGYDCAGYAGCEMGLTADTATPKHRLTF
jgi:hypothetical protein